MGGRGFNLPNLEVGLTGPPVRGNPQVFHRLLTSYSQVIHRLSTDFKFIFKKSE